MTCQHFTYGVDKHCHTLVGCNLREKQLQQGEHLTKRCTHLAEGDGMGTGRLLTPQTFRPFFTSSEFH